MSMAASGSCNLEQQIDEFELLQSVYSGSDEFQIEDQVSYDLALAYLKQLTPDVPAALSCRLNILIDAHLPSDDEEQQATGGRGAPSGVLQYSVKVAIRLPNSYPDCPPEVYISSNDLSRKSQDNLNIDLKEFISSSHTPGEPCLLSATEWIRDNAGSYFPIPINPFHLESESDTAGDDQGAHFCRMWLYMHHIYSKTKRRNILSNASELDLTGFCLPGKPGIVCVEGTVNNTKEFYSILRRWNWKSIGCRKREVEDGDIDASACRKVSGFQELVFDTDGHRQNMGQFLEYLKTHQLEYMFKELFGVEGHSTSHS